MFSKMLENHKNNLSEVLPLFISADITIKMKKGIFIEKAATV